jgi:hypothetical protein
MLQRALVLPLFLGLLQGLLLCQNLAASAQNLPRTGAIQFDRPTKILNYGFEIQKSPYRVEWFDSDLYLLKGDILLKQDNKAEARTAWQYAADHGNKDYTAVKEAQKRLDANP